MSRRITFQPKWKALAIDRQILTRLWGWLSDASRLNHPGHEFRLYWITLLVFAGSLVVILTSIHSRSVLLEYDEVGFMNFSPQYFDLYFVHPDFTDPLWQAKKETYCRSNPRVGEYFLGFIGRLTRHLAEQLPRVKWQRRLMAPLAAACVASFFYLCAASGSLLTGIAAALLLLINPVFRSVQVALLPDIPMTLFAIWALFYLLKIERRLELKFCGWPDLILFGIFAGLAVSCKLYASALFPVLLVLLARRARRDTWKALAGGLVVAAVSGLLFIASNPTLMRNFWSGLVALTVEHLQSQKGQAAVLSPTNLKYLLYYPFVAYQFEPFNISNQLPYTARWNPPFLIFGYLSALIGILRARRVFRMRDYTPLLWFVSSFLVAAYVISVLPTPWVTPRAFVLPTLSLVWLSSFAVSVPSKNP